ncbi:vesicle-associated membrane protein-associated protein A [Drosophila ficusphila]|uniref:vesicle-associated membrane protein-associated protein A n=1 Tax=Drosophila ficusphila TaxID=30025 RepID=UPI0007E813C0|nr:vesicle-associated membrane protein-associated protein A [Drosophila ficusphila]
MTDKIASKLNLEPCDGILFEGPFNRTVCKKLVIANPSESQRVAFKMKTTSPKLFFVRPNIGVLGPGEKVIVDIFMQPTAQEPLQNRHKFLLLAANATDDMGEMQEFWKQQKPEDLWDTKIKCELVDLKGEHGEIRVAGGGGSTARDKKQCEDHQFDAQEVTEPVAKLLKQVSMLEDERLALKEEIDTMRDQTIGSESGQGMMVRRRQGSTTLFNFVTFILIILAAVVGAFYGKNYL